jgi:hypothetical protein
MIFAVPTARLLAVILLIAILAACNHTQEAVVCAPLTGVTLVRVSQHDSPSSQQFQISDRYRIQTLVDFVNGRRNGFSARRKGLPTATISGTFYNGSQPLLTFAAGANLFSMTCSGYAGVQEANRVQIAEFKRLLNQQP